MMRSIAAIVEGKGEMTAVPILLRRIAQEVAPYSGLNTPRPVRVSRNRIVKEGELERAVLLASQKVKGHGGILVLLDADRDCPAQLAPQLLNRAVAVCPNRNIRLVLAKAEYEAWFLAAARSLAGRYEFIETLAPPRDPEAVRDAKGWIRARMPPG